MSDESPTPVKVDLGLSAKAELKINAEIPSESTGRIVDALTDVFRPFSEARGLRADQIRLQREDVLLEIARKASLRRSLDQPSVPLALKFIVPFLEKGSTENFNSELMDWWANLLVSAAANSTSQKPLFVDFLGKMTAKDAAELEKIWSALEIVSTPESDAHSFVSSFVRAKINMPPEDDPPKEVEFYEAAMRQTVKELSEKALLRGLVPIRVKFPAGKIGEGEVVTITDYWDMQSLETCLTIGILKREVLNFDFATPFIGSYDFVCEVICFSEMGAAFMKACHK